MKRIAVLTAAVAVLAAMASGARAGDTFKVKREYYTPYGKVKVKEYYNPIAYPYYGPVYSPYHVPGYPYSAPSPYSPPMYYPAAPYCWPSPYGVPYKVKIDD
jgi:hypothetical protein